MRPGQLNRINELARKAHTDEGLTEAEQAEQKQLRAAYIAAFRNDLKCQLDNLVVVEPDGTKHKLTQKEEPSSH